MARRKPATIADENGFFAPPAPPALIRMERERGEPRTADVHPAEAAKWTAKCWRAQVGAVREPPLREAA